MITIDVRVDAGRVGARCAEASKKIEQNITAAFRKLGPQLTLIVAREKLSGPPKAGMAGTGNLLGRRSGGLIRALFSKVFVANRETVLVVGADTKKAAYARILHEGGVIRPVHAQHLAIPLDAARTAKGVARMSAREFISNPESLGFDRAFVNRKGTAIMGARGDVAEPVFALKDSVTMPARPYIRDTVFERRTWILEQLRDVVTDGV